jgi:hypothetical protein
MAWRTPRKYVSHLLGAGVAKGRRLKDGCFDFTQGLQRGH